MDLRAIERRERAVVSAFLEKRHAMHPGSLIPVGKGGRRVPYLSTKESWFCPLPVWKEVEDIAVARHYYAAATLVAETEVEIHGDMVVGRTPTIRLLLLGLWLNAGICGERRLSAPRVDCFKVPDGREMGDRAPQEGLVELEIGAFERLAKAVALNPPAAYNLASCPAHANHDMSRVQLCVSNLRRLPAAFLRLASTLG